MEQVDLIQVKIVRPPIPEDVVACILAAAGEACCYCEDGITTRPYQIHHIELYSATSDYSEENLLLVCTNHHAVIHETKIPTGAQKHTRRKWPYACLRGYKNLQTSTLVRTSAGSGSFPA